MSRCGFALVLLFAPPATAHAAVVVVANYTGQKVSFTLSEPGQKPQTVELASTEVSPFRVTGPANIAFVSGSKPTTLRLDPYHAYVFVPDEKSGLRLEGIQMPGQAPERDARPELNPAPPGPVKVPVTLLVDDADPRTDAGWQKAIRARFESAAEVVEKHSGVRFTISGFDRWRSDPKAKDLPALLADFEKKVEVKAGQLAIGFTSRKVEDVANQPVQFGACRPFPTRHVVVREWRPEAESEKVETLIHHLGLALGATLSPDEGSVMRTDLGNGLARHAEYRYRFDPLNALAMSIWADEIRRGPLGRAGDAVAANRMRLKRVYQALLDARPGDSLSLGYLNEFDRVQAKEPEPVPGAEPRKPEPMPDVPVKLSPREEVARAVVRAVTARARANAGAEALRGDALTSAYVRAAAGAALAHDVPVSEEAARTSGFLIGLAIALDDSGALSKDVFTADVVRAVESDADREARLAILGNPTIRGRRDLCRHFTIGCGTGELLTSKRAEELAINRLLGLEEAKRPTGISFPTLAAEFAGIAFAHSAGDDAGFLGKIAGSFDPSRHLPDTAGLRDALPIERFEDDYGDPRDERFRKVLDDIRDRVKKVNGLQP
jgi:hypothetical protein